MVLRLGPQCLAWPLVPATCFHWHTGMAANAERRFQRSRRSYRQCPHPHLAPAACDVDIREDKRRAAAPKLAAVCGSHCGMRVYVAVLFATDRDIRGRGETKSCRHNAFATNISKPLWMVTLGMTRRTKDRVFRRRLYIA